MLSAKAEQIGDRIIVQVSGILMNVDKTPSIVEQSDSPTSPVQQLKTAIDKVKTLARPVTNSVQYKDLCSILDRVQRAVE